MAPWGDAERLWDRFLGGGVRAPAFRLVRLGSTLPRREYCRSAPIGNEQVDDVVEPNRVLEHYAAGATVVLQALQFSDPVFAELSTNLALELDHPVQVNAYLTPPAERGLDIHFDFHDVVVVQLAGRKRWRVWPPLPRSERPLKRGPAIAQPSPDELGDRCSTVSLERGDCLAVPRGFPHAAESDGQRIRPSDDRDHGADVEPGTARRDRRRRLRLGARRPPALRRPRWPPAPRTACAPTRRSLRSPSRRTDDRLRRAVATEVWRANRRPACGHADHVTIDAEQPLSVTPGPLLWLDTRSAADGRSTPCTSAIGVCASRPSARPWSPTSCGRPASFTRADRSVDNSTERRASRRAQPPGHRGRDPWLSSSARSPPATATSRCSRPPRRFAGGC